MWLAYREVLGLFWHVVGLFLLWATILSVGYLLCFVPGIYLFYRLFLAFPAFMVERRGIMDALSRSAELMRGNYLRVIILHMIISFVVKAALASRADVVRALTQRPVARANSMPSGTGKSANRVRPAS